MKGAANVVAIGVLGALVGVVGTSPLNSVQADLGGDQADSVRFILGYVPNAEDTDRLVGHIVYCGVDRGAEPYVLDVAVTNPTTNTSGGGGWLFVGLQKPTLDPDSDDGTLFHVPFGDSLSFSLTLGGVPGGDQMVRINTPDRGDELTGYGNAPFRGIASVRAQKFARDPFEGDDRDDNFCVSVGPPEDDPQRLVDGEFQEGEISTRLPVPDHWVIDWDGSDGGVLTGYRGPT
ncbi:MAG TPA: hypothetical protein VI916_01640 [Acidimicrobiia bacterium]|nr:hypothetical protein [Acidimicrobiia bacterium]